MPASFWPSVSARSTCDDLAEAENGDAVGDAEHLAHFMTDEDDGFALADKLLHDGEQSLDLDVGQGGGGLVKDQQLGPVVEGLEDLGALLFADGDLRDELVELDVEAVFSESASISFLRAARSINRPLACLSPRMMLSKTVIASTSMKC